MPDTRRRRALVLDVATGSVGEVMDRFTKDGRVAVYLRPHGGGREWTTFRDDLRLLLRRPASGREQ